MKQDKGLNRRSRLIGAAAGNGESGRSSAAAAAWFISSARARILPAAAAPQKQHRAGFRALCNLLAARRRNVPEHDRAQRLHREHAEQHAG
jgi:hypothetical protein